MPSEDVSYVLHIMEEAYSKVVWELKFDFDSYEAFERALLRVDRKSSPGWPYLKQASTNGDWLGWDGFRYDEYKKQSLWFDVCAIMKGELPWHLICFMKAEPHKPSKVETGRWRLIMASPLSVQVWWHMLFDELNDLEVEHAYHIPSQQGLILPHGGWKLFYRQWKSRGYDTGLDKTAWDWTVRRQLLAMDLELRTRLCRGERKGEWRCYADRAYVEMFDHPTILMSSGKVYRQMFPGIMKSGCVNTISTNSHIQVMIHILACKAQCVSYEPLPVCCGDDTLQCQFQATDVEAYRKFGALVKSASDGMEFVGHEFVDRGPMPIYVSKHIAKAMYVRDQDMDDYLDSMARMYCKVKFFEFWEWLSLKLGRFASLKSREYYNYWYDEE